MSRCLVFEPSIANPPLSPKPSVPRDGEIYRNAGVGFEFGDSQSSDGIVVERGESMGEGEESKVKRVGMSKYWDASQSQGDVEGEGEDEGEEDEKCGPRPKWFDEEGEVLGESKHHVCVCSESSSRRCYDDDGYGDTYPVFKSVEDAKAYDGEAEFKAYFPAEPCPCMVRRKKELALIADYRKTHPVSCDNKFRAGCLRPDCFPRGAWSDDLATHRKCHPSFFAFGGLCRVWEKRNKHLEVRHQCGSDCDSLDCD